MVAIRMHRLLRGRGKERGGRRRLRAPTSEARGGRGGGELVVLLLLLLLLRRHLRRAVHASKIEARQTTSAPRWLGYRRDCPPSPRPSRWEWALTRGSG